MIISSISEAGTDAQTSTALRPITVLQVMDHHQDINKIQILSKLPLL